MKGAAQFVVGIVIIIIYAVLFANDMSMNASTTEKVSGQSYKALSTLNYAESLKRTIDGSVEIASITAAKGLGIGKDNFDDNKDNLKNEIENRMKITRLELAGKQISWGRPSIKEIKKLDDESGFEVTGSYPFFITNKPENPTAEFEMSGNFHKKIKFSEISEI